MAKRITDSLVKRGSARTVKPNCVNNKEPDNLPKKEPQPVETKTVSGGMK